MAESKSRVDKEVALMRVGGDEELLREVAALFLENESAMMDAIKDALAAQDAAAVELHAHSLKGSVSNFGADEAVEAALAIESAGRAKDLSLARERFGRLRETMRELRPELERLAAAS